MIALEFETVTAPLPEVEAWLVENVRVRPGFRELVARRAPLVVSAGFHELIEPVLEREGVEVELVANRIDAAPGGWRAVFHDTAPCPVCGEPCKRASLPAGEPVVFAGDGYSDRCAALAAERVFATGSLAVLPRAPRRAVRAADRLPRPRKASYVGLTFGCAAAYVSQQQCDRQTERKGPLRCSRSLSSSSPRSPRWHSRRPRSATTAPLHVPGAKLAQAQEKLNHLKQKCDSKPEAAAKCAKLAAGVLARLDKLSARIDALESKINEKCSVANPPEKCSKAADVLARLDAAKQDIAQLEAWIKANFSGSCSATAPGA